MESMVKNLEKAITYGVAGLTAILPVFFLPITTEFYDFNKNMLMMAAALILAVLWTVKMVVQGEVSFRHTRFDWPVLAIALSVLLTTFLISPNRWEVLWSANAAGTIIALTILYFVITNNVTLPSFVWLVLPAGVLALGAIYQFVGLGEAMVGQESAWAWLRSKAWTPAGSLLALAMFLGSVLIVLGRELYQKVKKNGQQQDRLVVAGGLALVIIALGLLVTGYQLVTTFRPLLLPYRSSWIIALEVLKFPINLVLGTGTAGFSEAFTRFRPPFYNASEVWLVRFSLSGSCWLHLLTTTGVLGLASWLIVAGKVIRERIWSVMLILTIWLFLPITWLMLFLFYLWLAEAAKEKAVKEYRFSGHLNLARLVLALTVILTAVGGWQLGRIYAAETYFKEAMDAFNANKGGETYQLQIKALTLNPHNDTYYVIYAKTNFLLANALADQKDLSDQEKQNLTALVQQAIDQAKNAVRINPGRVTNWENLAGLYRSLINFAQGADGWTTQALAQAMTLDPVNPELRFSLGSVFYGLKNYDQAIRYFEQAINLKADVPNYYYNLAAVYKERKEWERALAALQMTSQLLPVDSADFKKLQEEIKEAQGFLPKATPAAGTAAGATSELQKPQSLPTPKLKEPLQLPEEAAPEIPPAPSTETAVTPTP